MSGRRGDLGMGSGSGSRGRPIASPNRPRWLVNGRGISGILWPKYEVPSEPKAGADLLRSAKGCANHMDVGVPGKPNNSFDPRSNAPGMLVIVMAVRGRRGADASECRRKTDSCVASDSAVSITGSSKALTMPEGSNALEAGVDTAEEADVSKDTRVGPSRAAKVRGEGGRLIGGESVYCCASSAIKLS